MSTLYEALRKAELEQHKKSVFAPQIQEKSASSVPRVIVIALVTVAAFWACLGAYRLWLDFRNNAVKQEQAKKVAAMKAALPAAGTASMGRVRAPGTYGLDGVIYAGEDSMAVINGKYLKTGEMIDYLVVKAITPDSAEVLNTKDDKVQTFRLGQ
jgi:hypothetical protein